MGIKKHFNITKSTPQSQILVEQWTNVDESLAGYDNKRQKLFNDIKNLLNNKVFEMVIIKCYYCKIDARTIDNKQFDKFIDDSLNYFLEVYNPLYTDGSYKKPANFDTYYLNCIRYYIDLFLAGGLVTEHLQKIELEKQRKRDEREEMYNQKIELLKLENKPIVQLSDGLKPIRKFKNNMDVLKYINQSSNQSDSFLINIQSACKGLQQTCMGYKWMYEEDYKNIK